MRDRARCWLYLMRYGVVRAFTVILTSPEHDAAAPLMSLRCAALRWLLRATITSRRKDVDLRYDVFDECRMAPARRELRRYATAARHLYDVAKSDFAPVASAAARDTSDAARQHIRKSGCRYFMIVHAAARLRRGGV